MAVTNMSIIEKDDLIKKMPRDALKEELRNPSGTFPLFLVAARLKEVEEMERDVMARRAAQQSSQEGESVAARLAQQAMPESPMSEIGANPAPQPRPDPQGIMAQQIAGPTQPLPTVMARRGLQGKYPGESSGIDQEVLAAAVRSRQAGGAPRLYNRGRKVGFEEAGTKGAAPASQIPALFGLASALAKTEERAYGGMETLPPFQVESGALPMSVKGFAARARSVGSKMPEEDSGLAYVSKLLESMGSPSKDKPTVFAKEGFTSIKLPPRFTVPLPPISRPGPASLPYASELDSVPEGYEQKIARLRDAERLRAARAAEKAEIEQGDLIANEFQGAPPVSPPASPGIADAQKRAKNIAINRGVLPSREQAANHWSGLDKLKKIINPLVNPQEYQPLLDKSAIEPAVEGASAAIKGGAQTVGDVVSNIGSGFAKYPSEVAAAYNLPNKLTGGDRSIGNVEFSLPEGSPSAAQAVFGPGGVDRMLTAAAKADASEASDGSASTSGITAGSGGNNLSTPAADVTSNKSGLAPMRLPTETTVTTAPVIPAVSSDLMIGGLSRDDLAAPEIADVKPLSYYVEQTQGALPDFSKQRKKIISDYEDQLKEIEKREPVPKSTIDMRQRMQNRLDALENSPLPFMTAAAAAIKGNQPILVAMTNAMIGYTAGDEKVKNQGLKIMGDIVDLDANIATMKAKQSELELTARNALIKARQADLEGQDKRAREILTLANSQQNAARTAAVETAKLESAALNRVTNLVTGTLKTTAEVERFERQKALYMESGMSELEAAKKAFSDFQRPVTPNFAAANYQAKKDSAVDDFFNKPDGLRKIIDEYNAANPENRIGRQSMSPENIAKAIRSVGIDRLPSNADIRRQILQDPRSGMSGGTGGEKDPLGVRR